MMDHPCLSVCSLMENSIGLKKVKHKIRRYHYRRHRWGRVMADSDILDFTICEVTDSVILKNVYKIPKQKNAFGILRSGRHFKPLYIALFI